MDTVSNIILEELRDLRSSFNHYSTENGERLSALETQIHSLVGNGQPGRITVLEHAVAGLERSKFKLIGAAAGGGGVVSLITSLFVWRK